MRTRGLGVLALALVALGTGCAGSVTNGQTMYLGRADLVSVRVANSLPTATCHLFMTPIQSSQWGLDWLAGEGALRSGEERAFRVPRGHWDLRAVSCDGADVATFQSAAVDEQHSSFALGTPPPAALRPPPPEPATTGTASSTQRPASGGGPVSVIRADERGHATGS